MNSSFVFYNRDRASTSSNRNHPYPQLNHSTLALCTTKTAQNDSSRSDDQPNAVIEVGKKLIVGSVDQVVRWCHELSFIESTKIIYQVFGIMKSVQTGRNKCEKIFCLRSVNKSSGIVCVFYEIDRKIPNISEGTFVLCTGHVKGKNKLQIFSIREVHEDKDTFDRISLVSQWAVNDILIHTKL